MAYSWKIKYIIFMIDLHTHTTASDGSLNSQELVQLALSKNLTALAITDHDTCNGLALAHEAALGTDLKIINGIEIEIACELDGVFHLLGLGIDPQAPGIHSLISELSKLRELRNEQIIHKMHQAGIDIQLSVLKAANPGAVLGRPHFAAALVQLGLCRDLQEAFSKYLGSSGGCYVKFPGLALAWACEQIKRSGGRSFLAHPQSLYVSLQQLRPHLHNWQAQGLDGLEVWHPGLKYRQALKLETMAQDLGLLVCGGSDFHGSSKPDRQLGRSLQERRKIDSRFLACLD
jgi:3',5'-nucleoside bisphosphate phosphatase